MANTKLAGEWRPGERGEGEAAVCQVPRDPVQRPAGRAQAPLLPRQVGAGSEGGDLPTQTGGRLLAPPGRHGVRGPAGGEARLQVRLPPRRPRTGHFLPPC